MSHDNLQLLTIALQLLETVMRNENIDINVASYPGSIQAYNAGNSDDIAVIERLEEE